MHLGPKYVGIMFGHRKVPMTSPSVHSARFLVFALIVVVISSPVLAQTVTPASQPRVVLESVTSSEPFRDGIAIQAGSATLRITALRDDIIRVRIAPGSTLPEDASWAVLPASREKSVDVQPTQDATSVGFRTKSLDVRVERNPLRLVVRDLAGNIICADALGRPTEFSLGGFTVSKEMPADERFFGLGDKTGSFDRRNQAYTLWNTDHGIEESLDPIYKSIPFFLAISGGRSYGLFLDNTWRTWFDFGKRSRDAYSFGAEGGPLNYYLIYGPTPKQVVEGYIFLTGTPPLASAVVARLPAVPLQLLPGIRTAQRSPTACAPTRFPPTCSISTSTTSSATAPSPSIP